ncbi:MAG: ABC transporter substrate-binding protein [Actinobacteria bacterium]|nr:ABC transporter substrate-binding protein [Actinomycetota bacterium]
MLETGTITVSYGRAGASPVPHRDRVLERSARIAAREINSRGGIDGKVRIRLVRGGAPVRLLPCPFASPQPDRQSVLALATCNDRPDLLKASRTIRPVGMDANQEAAQLAEHVRAEGFRSAWLVTVPGSRLGFYLRRALRDLGVRILGATASSKGASAQVARIRPARPDALVTEQEPPELGRLLRDLRQAGIEVPVLGTHRLDSRALLALGSVAEGVTFTAFGYPDPGSPLDEFQEKYRAHTGSPPDGSYAALGYVAVKVLEAAVQKARSTDPARLATAFDGLEARSVLGPVRYGDRGDPSPRVQVALVRVQDGRFELIDRGMPEPVPDR